VNGRDYRDGRTDSGADDPLDLDTGLPARVAADAAVLSPVALALARRMSASADAGAIMGPDHKALAREIGVDVAAIVEALGQLVRRGHLVVLCGDDGRPGYRLAGAPANKPAPHLVPFPRRRDHALVMRHAEPRLSQPMARIYLRRMMRVYAEEMRSRGIAEAIIEREVDALTRAIRNATWRAVLTPDDQEPA
jgi:hypothetical protein